MVMTTVAKRTEAQRLARKIVAARLAACVQTMPIRSVYRWQGRVESAAEHLLLVKTRAALAKPLTAFIRKHHTYQVPEIVTVPVTGGLPAYLRWLADETA